MNNRKAQRHLRRASELMYGSSMPDHSFGGFWDFDWLPKWQRKASDRIEEKPAQSPDGANDDVISADDNDIFYDLDWPPDSQTQRVTEPQSPDSQRRRVTEQLMSVPQDVVYFAANKIARDLGENAWNRGDGTSCLDFDYSVLMGQRADADDNDTSALHVLHQYYKKQASPDEPTLPSPSGTTRFHALRRELNPHDPKLQSPSTAPGEARVEALSRRPRAKDTKYPALEEYVLSRPCSVCNSNAGLRVIGACECRCVFHPFCFLTWSLQQWEKRDWPHVEKRNGGRCEVCTKGRPLLQPSEPVYDVRFTLQSGRKKPPFSYSATIPIRTWRLDHCKDLAARTRPISGSSESMVIGFDITDPPNTPPRGQEFYYDETEGTFRTDGTDIREPLYWNGMKWTKTPKLGAQWRMFYREEGRPLMTPPNAARSKDPSSASGTSYEGEVQLNASKSRRHLQLEMIFVHAFHAKHKRLHPRTTAKQRKLDRHETKMEIYWKGKDLEDPAPLESKVHFPTKGIHYT